MMEFEADRMTGLILKDENVLPERDVVLEEYNMRVANNPDARLTEQIMAALYLNHPYGRPVIGWRQEIEKLDREDALAFYKRFYAPNNATLVIAGDVDAKEIRPMVEKTYGAIPAAARHSRRAHPSAGAGAGRAAHGDAVRPSRRADQLRRYYLVPSVDDRRSRRKPGARRARAIDGRRLQLLSLPRAGRSTSRSRSAPAPAIRAPRSIRPVLDLGVAEAGRGVSADRAGHRCRDRQPHRKTRPRRGPRTGQDPADRGSRSTPRTTRRRWHAGMAAR